MQLKAVSYFITLATLVSHSGAELVIIPRITETKVGDTTYFNCSTNLETREIFWNHDDKYIYTGETILDTYHKRFEIDRNSSIGSYNLVIHSVQPSDAGEYICIDDDGHGMRRSAELVILGIKALIVGPSNTAVTVGKRMEMKCQVDSGLIVREWSIQKMLTSKADTLFTHWKNRSRIINAHFGVEVDDFGSGIFYINSTTLDDAGIYICTIGPQGGTMQPQKYSAHLIVFESDPMCHSNSTLPLNATMQEETYVRLRCTVNFRGHLDPVIEWRQHEGVGEDYEGGREITNLADTEVISNSTVTSNLTLDLKSITYQLFYSFKIYFKPANIIRMTTATNAPEYSYTWKTPVVVVASTHSRSDLSTILAAVLVCLVVALSMTVIIRCIIHCKTPSREPVTEVTPMASRQAPSMSNVLECHVNQYSRKPNYVGDDGTEYMEVNAIGRQPMAIRLPAEPNIFSVVGEYASIDHTLSSPIPLR